MGNVIMVYGFSNADSYPSLAVSEQATTDGLNTMEQPLILLAGTQLANDANRYGDYFSAALDPFNPTNVYVAGEIMDGNSCNLGGSSVNCWSTYIAEIPQNSYFTSNAAVPTILAGQTGAGTASASSYYGFAAPISWASQVSISITANDIDDNNYRAFGLLWDTPLNYPDFWNSQPNSVIGDGGPGTFTYSSSQPQTFPTSCPGCTHYLDFGVSAWTGEWHVQISLNGLQMSDIDTDVNHHVRIYFYVGSVTVTSGPSGYVSPPNCAASPWYTSLRAGGVASVNLNCSTSTSTTPGTYTFNVASSGEWELTQISIPVTVTNNALTNPGFETGSFTSWSASSGACIRTDSPSVHSGSYAAAPCYNPNTLIYAAFTLQQNFSPIAGSSITSISLWQRYGTSADSIRVLYTDGTYTQTTLGSVGGTYTLVNVPFTSTKTVNGIEVIRSSGQGTVLNLDDFAVTT